MKTSRFLFEVFHYSKAEHILIACVMTAVTSIVLLGKVYIQPVVIVSLGTYFVYSVDNILDWYGEKHLLPNIQLIWKYYILKCLLFLPASLVFILVLVRNHQDTLLILIFLGILTLGQVFFTKQLAKQEKGKFVLWVERIVDAIVWSLVTVFVPVTYVGVGIFPQVLMVIAFNFFITFIIVMIWDITRSATNGFYHGATVLSDIYTAVGIITHLQYLCIAALLLAAIDILLGYFPIYNLIVLIAPGLYLFLLFLYPKFEHSRLMYSALFSFASVLSCLSILFVYTLAK